MESLDDRLVLTDPVKLGGLGWATTTTVDHHVAQKGLTGPRAVSGDANGSREAGGWNPCAEALVGGL